MKRVTRNVDPGSVQDLLDRVPRACLSFASDHGPQVQPVRLLWHEGRYLAGIPGGIERQPISGQEVVLLIDDGIYYFDLRALYIRGQVRPAEVASIGPAGCTWFEVVPSKTVAWDYGALRELGNEG